jgi:serine/threonine protein kinase
VKSLLLQCAGDRKTNAYGNPGCRILDVEEPWTFRERSGLHGAGAGQGKEVDKRADIWAFGVVLYELVTGSRPFPGTDVSEILASVIKENPIYESVPYELCRLLKKYPLRI